MTVVTEKFITKVVQCLLVMLTAMTATCLVNGVDVITRSGDGVVNALKFVEYTIRSNELSFLRVTK
jgi:hypothetical protein